MFDVRFQLNSTPFIRTLQQVEGTITNLAPLWPDVAAVIRSIFKEQFDTQGGHGGAVWAPLTHPYAERKELEWPGKTILRASDEMFESFTVPGASGAIYLFTPRQLIMGSSLERATWHQEGTERMAARKIINLTAKDEERIIDVLEANLVRAMQAQGFEVH